ncbi:MAG TPA: phosphotransferase [Acidimicrobiia bacterium]|nr:phosphotransferase [Acidimicrobiia bacterium]
MTVLGRDHPEDVRTWMELQHGQWVTPTEIQRAILNHWGITDVVIGERMATGEATEVYRVHKRPTEGQDDGLLGYLRIANHGGLNDAEIILMEACRAAGLPSVELLHSSPYQLRNGQISSDLGATFLAPAVGLNLAEAIEQGTYDIEVINTALRNAGALLAHIHSLPDVNVGVAQAVERGLARSQRDDFSRDLAFLRRTMQYIPEATPLLQHIKQAARDHKAGLADIQSKYPRALVHADFDPKHLFFDPLTGDITSLIDFGGAHVNVAHADFFHWKTFSPMTYEVFLDAYLDERFGFDLIDAQEFEAEIDLAYAACNLRSACVRMDQLLVNEAVGHLHNCASACDRIAPRVKVPTASEGALSY